jgi:hypothetical protein
MSFRAEEHYLIIYTIYRVVSLSNNALRRLLHLPRFQNFANASPPTLSSLGDEYAALCLKQTHLSIGHNAVPIVV